MQEQQFVREEVRLIILVASVRQPLNDAHLQRDSSFQLCDIPQAAVKPSPAHCALRKRFFFSSKIYRSYEYIKSL